MSRDIFGVINKKTNIDGGPQQRDPQKSQTFKKNKKWKMAYFGILCVNFMYSLSSPYISTVPLTLWDQVLKILVSLPLLFIDFNNMFNQLQFCLVWQVLYISAL